MKPIWYFVGLLLLVLGAIICVNGVYLLASPPAHETVLGNLHPDIWWGAIMAIAGAIFLLTNKNKTVEH